MQKQNNPLPEVPNEWTREYITRVYEEPYGCFLFMADILRERFNVTQIPECDMELKDSDDSIRSRGAIIVHALADKCLDIHHEDLEEGDIVVLQSSGHPIHVGILVARNQVMHCDTDTNTTIERLDSPRWKNRVFGYYRPSEHKNK